MLTCFSIRFTVVAVIAALAVSAVSIPRPRERGNGVSIPLTKYYSSSFNSKYASKQIGPQNWKRDDSVSELDLTLDELYWHGSIWVGTPPKLFDVQIDTGTSDLVIPASNGDVNCRSHTHLYNPASSATAKNLGKGFYAQFVDGDFAIGNQYTDNITISDLTADKQTIGVATTYSPKFGKSTMPPDGILGLGLSSILSVFPATSLLETLFTEGKLADRVFAFRLSKSGEGILYIGVVNKEQYTGDITFVNVVQPANKGRWMVMVDDIRVNNKPVLGRLAAIIDTGASHILGHPHQVLELHKAYGGKAFKNGWYTFPCDHFPDVIFTLGGKPFTIPASELNLGPVTKGSSDCFSGIISPTVPLPFVAWVIGCHFLELFYTVFNMDSKQPQVGFAQLAS